MIVAKVYTVKEMAKALKIGYNKAYELVATGEIKSIKIGRQIRIPEKYLDEFIESKIS
jgi:excisionase family DNA binding protein